MGPPAMTTDPGRDQDRQNLPVGERPGVPRWVKIFGLIALAVVLVLVVVMLLGGEHGPGMHSSVSGNPQHAAVMYAGNIPL